MFNACVQRFDGMVENFLGGELNRETKGNGSSVNSSHVQNVQTLIWTTRC